MFSKASAPSSLIVARRTFSDIDEFAATTLGWDLDFPDGKSRLNWAARESSSAVIIDFNNPSGFEGASGPGFSGITLSISNEMLSRIAEPMGLRAAPFIGSSQSLFRSGEEQKFDQLRQYLHVLYSRLSMNSKSQDAYGTLAGLENEVPVQLLIALAEPQQPLCDQPLWARQKGLRLAIAFIEENAHDNSRIPDVCTACGLSWRSLDRAFKEYFGISPKRYLLHFRLTRVRQQLKDAPPGAKVGDIANAWGFWHMGDFAQKYRKFFGDYPAEQLMKYRR